MKIVPFAAVAIMGGFLSSGVCAETEGELVGKGQLIDEIAIETGLNREDVETTVDLFLGKIKRHIAQGDKVSLSDFGTFSVRERPARQATNPQTGEEIYLKASRSPTFKAAKALKETVDEYGSR